MSDAIDKDNRPAEETKKSGTNPIQVLLIGGAILAVAALLAYQIFGCSGCYG